jgi:hypothetical protein
MEVAAAQKFLQGKPPGLHRSPAKGPRAADDLRYTRHRSRKPVIIASRGTTCKVKYIRRDPRVSMLIFGEQYSGSKPVQIHGTAEIIDRSEPVV